MKIKRIVSLFLALVLALSAVAVLGSCKKSEKGITVQIGPNPETLDPRSGTQQCSRWRQHAHHSV